MVIGDILFFAAFQFEFYLIFLLLILSCSITFVKHLRLENCENFDLA